jgi:hypothetical protein
MYLKLIFIALIFVVRSACWWFAMDVDYHINLFDEWCELPMSL